MDFASLWPSQNSPLLPLAMRMCTNGWTLPGGK